ncbi:MAG: hypothetical protein PHE17_17835 [Thiothrix sp.]|uniref:hypothetical protein n=1 Tax=Thiothrix sp. TaxID=1032 RepID=UPI0026341F15|nr:hypothetical protein [Thiothrix sp.]MDD5394883.1 hypothetical protein [Thiothrix sp.]
MTLSGTTVPLSLKNALGGRLNQQQLAIFMRKAIPELKRDYAQLCLHLENQQWVEASKVAHQLKAIVKLLGMDELLPYLQTVETAAAEGIDSQHLADALIQLGVLKRLA